ncbi:GGDEF domain-containing phosphodiesterase [Alkalicoccus urumqiensis]|uniref:GGDEF domain-containing phosphodiesterase n=1 Tax=Alkalicoccus urumqiensis TaxID=1548213 RepID=UPI0015E5DC64|nr:GGDEF domain-containing phosphodiesterase [Alkalicoccus urumqiensis]
MSVSQALLNAMETKLVVINREGLILYSNGSWDQYIHQVLPQVAEDPSDRNYFRLMNVLGTNISSYQILSIFHGVNDLYEQDYRCPGSAEETWYRLKAVPLGDDAQSPLLLISHTDISQMIFYERNALEVIESMNDSFVVLHKDNTVKFMNHRAELLLRKPREEMLNVDVQESLGIQLNHFLTSKLTAARETLLRQTFDYYAEERKSWFEITLLPHQNGDVACFFQNINDKMMTLKTLEEGRYFDNLTSLPNRERLTGDLELFTAERTPFTIVTLSMKDFQETNNLYGHEAADQLLKAIAFRLQKAFIDYRIYRYTGDEFLLILDDAYSGIDMQKSLQQLEECLTEPFPINDAAALPVDFRKSVVTFPKDGDSPFRILQAVDAARLSLKNGSASSSEILFYTPELGETHLRSFLMKRDLLPDVDNGAVSLVYQPQVDGQTGSMTGVEVLARWEHEEAGPISPAEFIPAAEKAGLISEFTLKIIRRGLTLLQQLRAQHAFSGTMAFNLSSSSLKEEAFIDTLASLPAAFDLPPSSIELEITETVELTSDAGIPSHLKRLSDAGFRIAIDDFGTGYSKINYLDQFPIHKIKIDRYFVEKIPASRKKAPVLDAVLELVRSVNLDLLIEGVEESYQVEYLLARDCRSFQGFYFHQPLREDELLSMMEEERLK